MSQRPRTDRPAPQTAGTTQSDQPPTVQAEELLELLGDEYTRCVLRAITDQARTGREIVEATDASKPTVYRRLDQLEEAGLVDVTQKIDPDGHHCKQFSAVIAGFDFEFDQDGVSVSVQEKPTATSDDSQRVSMVADD